MLRLAQMGILPKQFLKLKNDLPPCVSCQFGKAHRKPWRIKTSKSGKLSTLRVPDPLEPGEMIAVDQLISAQPGLVPQERGSMTRARIWAATIFVDFATRYVYVALMRDQSGEATLEAKAAFEHHCATRDVRPKHYRGDNGRFAEQSFKDAVKELGQSISFCGVGDHHQNGIAERMIKEINILA